MADEKGLKIGWPYWPFNLENLISGQAGKIKDKAGLTSVGHSGCHQLLSLLVEQSAVHVMVFPHCLDLAGQVRAESKITAALWPWSSLVLSPSHSHPLPHFS